MGLRERKEREREARRQAILAATRELLRERGFGGTTTKLIAARCELSEAAVFWYFETKDAILTTLFFEGIELMTGRFDEVLASPRGPRDKLEALLLFFVELRATHPEYFQLYTYLAAPHAVSELAPALKTKLAEHSGRLFRQLAELVREIVGSSEARLRADLLWSQCVGLAVLRDARANLDLGAKVHPTDAEVRRAVQIMLDGIVGTKRGGQS